MELEIKYQACNLCDALLRNINDNFESVSFEITANGDIQIKFVLFEITEQEEEYIDDVIVELISKQSTDCILAPILALPDSPPLQICVYKKASASQ